MTISRENLKIFKPQQLGSSDDAGGQRTKNEVESGKLNELFRAISDIDHAQSAVDIVKCYPGLDTNDTSILLDGHVFISEQPTDALVNMLIAESDTLADADNMTNMVEILESSVVAGQLIRKGLIGLLAGQDSFPRSYLQASYMYNGKEYYETISLNQGQIVVISVEYEGNEDGNWPRFEHFCEIQVTVTGGRGGAVRFKPPIPFDTPGYNVSINGESGCTKLRYINDNDGIKYHGVSKLTAEANSEVLAVESTQTELLPKLKTVEVSSGNTITSDDDGGDVASSLIRKVINVPTDQTKTTYLYTVLDLIDDPYFVTNGITPIVITGSYPHLGKLSVTGTTVSVVYSHIPREGYSIGIAWYSSLRYAVYHSEAAWDGLKKLTVGSVFASADFVDTNYGSVKLTESSSGELREPNGYILASVDYLSGVITKYADARGDFNLVYDALVEAAELSDNSATFSLSQTDPLLDTFYLIVSTPNDQLLSASSDADGVITGTGISGTIENGVVQLSFTQIVDLATLRYDISETVTLSPPPELYGLNPLRIKNAGVVDSFTAWNTVSVQHTQAQAVLNPAPGASLNVRANARFVNVTDANSQSLWTLNNDNYSVDKATGLVSINSNFSGFTAPFVLTDTIGEVALVTDVQPNKLILASALSQAYPIGSNVSSVQNLGDLQGRVGIVRDMSAWNNNWDLDGAPAVGSLNVVDHPIVVINNTAINEEWVLIFTSATAFRCVGQRIGQIALGDTLSDFAPINPLTQAPYFVIPQAAFGGGWNAGEAVRFPTYASAKPIMLLRTVQSGHSQISKDRAVLAFRGNES